MTARPCFMTTERLAFSVWTEDDAELAALLWGDPAVSRFICAAGVFTQEEISARLQREIRNQAEYGLQYWPVFERCSGELAGCCGLRPHGEEAEIGVHLRPAFWHNGFAAEAVRAVIKYAFEKLGAEKLFAGHNPANTASAGLLKKLGFRLIGTEFYAPTGLQHPSYEYTRQEWEQRGCDH